VEETGLLYESPALMSKKSPYLLGWSLKPVWTQLSDLRSVIETFPLNGNVVGLSEYGRECSLCCQVIS
jgi:hypothetical protein